jgi:hypothetical protein
VRRGASERDAGFNRAAITVSIMLATIMQGVDNTTANVALWGLMESHPFRPGGRPAGCTGSAGCTRLTTLAVPKPRPGAHDVPLDTRAIEADPR